LISALTGGRPLVVRLESWAQYSRKRRRCHRRTVSGVTIRRDCLHLAQTLASPTQNSYPLYRQGRIVAIQDREQAKPAGFEDIRVVETRGTLHGIVCAGCTGT
jgi:hypothetical protein